MGLLSAIFGSKTKKIKDFQLKGATVLDVRSAAEYAQGPIPGSKHISLHEIGSKMDQIKKWNSPVITCCASGMRSASASALIKRQGIEAMNGGRWFRLHQILDAYRQEN
jgi:rhodanese-related sulfurtransferase